MLEQELLKAYLVGETDYVTGSDQGSFSLFRLAKAALQELFSLPTRATKNPEPAAAEAWLGAKFGRLHDGNLRL
jgi:hypothetical protein